MSERTVDIFADTLSGHIGQEANETWRTRVVTQNTLLSEATSKGKFIGENWGKYLRAPDIYWTIVEKGKDKLTRLGDMAEVKRGFTTGVNDFFYVRDVTDSLGDEKLVKLLGLSKRELDYMELRAVVSGDDTYHLIEKKFLKPVVISPNELSKYEISPSKSVVLVSEKKAELKAKRIFDYINYGESQRYNSVTTTASRKQWYDLGKPIKSPIVFPERYRLRYFVPRNPSKVLLNKNFYGIGDGLSKANNEVLWGILNSTITGLFAEVNSRQPGGGGAPVDLDVWMVGSLKVLDYRKLPLKTKRNIRVAMQKIAEREVLPISEEVTQSDRQSLDRLVLEAIGFKEDEVEHILKQLYDGFNNSVKTRITKAVSGNKKSTKKKTDPKNMAIQIAIDFKELGDYAPNEVTYIRLKRFIKERTPLRKLQETLLPLTWQELFGLEAELPIPTQQQLFE